MTGMVRADPKPQHLPSALTGLRPGKLVFAGVTDEGWLYLTGVIDLFSRQVVGWSMKEHMRSSTG